MITITPEAAKMIKASAEQGGAAGLPLRIAVTKMQDGSLHYGMGFDDQRREDDIAVTAEGINVVISALSHELAKGMTIDYVEMEPGQYSIIFLNPNDPSHRPPPSLSGGKV